MVLLTVSQLTTGLPELLKKMFCLALFKGKRLCSARRRQSHLAFFRLPVIQQVFYLALFKGLRLRLARLRQSHLAQFRLPMIYVLWSCRCLERLSQQNCVKRCLQSLLW